MDLDLINAQLARMRSEFDDSFSREASTRDESSINFVLLLCGGTKYAVALSEVSLLQGNVKVARVPNAKGSLLGICGVRGELLAVFDLAKCLRRETQLGAHAWIFRARGTSAAFAFERCDGLVEGTARVTTGGVTLAAVKGELLPLLAIEALIASARGGALLAGNGNGNGNEEHGHV
jgi:hypothetical protein